MSIDLLPCMPSVAAGTDAAGAFPVASGAAADGTAEAATGGPAEGAAAEGTAEAAVAAAPVATVGTGGAGAGGCCVMTGCCTDLTGEEPQGSSWPTFAGIEVGTADDDRATDPAPRCHV